MITPAAMLKTTALVLLAFAVAAAAEGGLVGGWVFDRDHIEGGTVKDIAGNLDARLSGGARLDAAGIALILDGTATVSLSAGALPRGLPRRAISVEAWVAVEEPSEWGGIISCLQDNGGFEKGWLLGTRNRRFAFALSTTGADDGDGTMTYLTADSDFVPGAWYHVAGVYDGKEQRIYVNGQLAGATKKQSGEILYPERTFYDIAAYHDDNEHYRLKGRLHEVRVYNRALNAGAVKARFKAKAKDFPRPLQLTFGPVLRWVSADTVSISWSTAEPGGGAVVELGANGAPGETVAALGRGFDHEVVIHGIEPELTYSYRVQWTGPGGEVRKTAAFTFDSPPDVGIEPVPAGASPYPEDGLTRHYEEAARWIVERAGADRGYCLVLGCKEGRLAYEIARRTKMRVIGVDPDKGRIDAARRALDSAGVYGVRVTVQQQAAGALPFPDYFANLIVSERTLIDGSLPESAAEVFRMLRPCGGAALIGRTAGFAAAGGNAEPDLAAWIAGAPAGVFTVLEGNGRWAAVRRGPLEGTGEWTHMYADPGNTACSNDRLAHGTLRLQWFGRPGPRLMIDRHHRNVPPLCKEGRLFVPADDRIIAVDAYNGTWLWDAVVPGSRRLGVFLDTSNMVVDDDRLYIVHHDRCDTYDVATGEPGRGYVMPQLDDRGETHWSFVARTGGLLFGSGRIPDASYTETSREADLQLWYDNMSIVTSRSFFALDPETGKPRWTYRSGVIINTTITIGGGRVYFIETHSPAALADRTGRMPGRVFLEGGKNYLVALDAKTGRMIYKEKIDLTDCRLIAYLNYADETLLLSGGRYVEKDLWYFFRTFNAATAKPGWSQSHDSGYDPGGGHGEQNRHPTIVGDMVYTYPYAYDLATGKRLEGYSFSRAGHGCGGVSASAGALYWRGGNPTMRNLDPLGPADKINHVSRPGCWINIIPAGGMVLIPEASSGCTCSFPLQTSMAYRPVPAD